MSRPDHVIQDRASASYIAEYGAPKLELENVHQFKNDTQNNLNNKIKARLGDLQKEYKELEDLYHFNVFVTNFNTALFQCQVISIFSMIVMIISS